MDDTQLKDDTTVVGKALYLEFSNVEDYDNSFVSQHILLPDAVIGTTFYPARVMARYISKSSPRAQWVFSNFVSGPESSRSGYHQTILDRDESGSVVHKSLDIKTASDLSYFAIANYVARVYETARNWHLVGSPIAVEVTAGELHMASLEDTPQGIIRRILRSRDARNMPTIVNKKS